MCNSRRDKINELVFCSNTKIPTFPRTNGKRAVKVAIQPYNKSLVEQLWFILRDFRAGSLACQQQTGPSRKAFIWLSFVRSNYSLSATQGRFAE